MYVENYFIGNQEYIITFKNGTHHVKEIRKNENVEIFSGHYEDCKMFLQGKAADYLYSLV